METLSRPEETAQKGGTRRSRASEGRTACRCARGDKDGGVGRGFGGNGGGYGRVRITCKGGDLRQTEIQYHVNSRHTPPCQTKFSKTETHSTGMPSFK